jgi:hypothetical protein
VDGNRRLVVIGRGAVLALEVSWLTRSSADWHRLLKLCGLADVVIIDEHAEIGCKVFGTMGLRGYDGAPRQPIFDRWTAARTLPITS